MASFRVLPYTTPIYLRRCIDCSIVFGIRLMKFAFSISHHVCNFMGKCSEPRLSYPSSLQILYTGKSVTARSIVLLPKLPLRLFRTDWNVGFWDACIIIPGNLLIVLISYTPSFLSLCQAHHDGWRALKSPAITCTSYSDSMRLIS